MEKVRQLNLNAIKTGNNKVKIVKGKLKSVTKQSIEILNQIESIINNDKQLIFGKQINWNLFAKKLKLQKTNLFKTIKKTYPLVNT